MRSTLKQPQKDVLPMEPEEISGAEIVIRTLIEEKVDTIFGYPGGAIMPIYDALYMHTERVKHILVRHEQGAIHAAQGYARVKGKAGVVFATSGPGATNLVTGLADALIDSTPVVCITGQVASHLLGTDAFQEADVMNTTVAVTKWNIQVTRAEDISKAIAKAFYIAESGRPGPVLIDITKDAQFSKAEFHYKPCNEVRTYRPVPIPDLNKIEDAALLINAAKRPYILAGQGILLSGATNELKDFAEKGQIPVASTLLGLSAIPSDHPLYAGFLGMHGNYAPNVNTNQCDVLIAIGMRFDDRVTGDLKKYARSASIIHIDIDDAELNKLVKTEVAILADAKQALTLLTPLITKKENAEWIQSFRALDEKEKAVIANACQVSEGELKMGEVISELNKVTNGEAIVVTDVGQHQMVTSRYFRYKYPYSNITSGGMGTMGFALPAALGAAAADSGRQVIAIIGDGGIQMTIQELGTIAQYGIPVKVIVMNNNFLGMVRQWQQLFFEKRYSSVEMSNPDFIKLAEAYGIPGKKTETRAALRKDLEDMFNHKGPFLLEAVVEKEENVFPMIPTGAGVSEMVLE